MIYTEQTKKAMKIAFAAHREQTDKSGLPYIYHPIHLAEQMDTEEAVTVALLHDVAEDTDTTLADLREMGFSEPVLAALECLTHREGVPYLDYVAALKENPLARRVKLADLAHNSDLTRLDTVDENARARVEKYKKAIALLQE